MISFRVVVEVVLRFVAARANDIFVSSFGRFEVFVVIEVLDPNIIIRNMAAFQIVRDGFIRTEEDFDRVTGTVFFKSHVLGFLRSGIACQAKCRVAADG